MNLDETRRRAQNDVHRLLSVPAIPYPPGDDGPANPGEAVKLRIHTEPVEAGALVGGSGYAEYSALSPKLIFVDYVPQKNWIFCIGPGEAYRVEEIVARRPPSVAVIAVRLMATDAARYAPPET